MITHRFEIPGGGAWGSGAGVWPAVCNVRLTRFVNTEKELMPGAVCAGLLEMELLTRGDALAAGAGTEGILYTCTEDGTERCEGYFILEEPVRVGANRYRLTAYDRVSLLDKDLAGWLASLTGWPYPLRNFASMVCDACGVSLVEAQIPNGNLEIPAFTASNITGRQLLQWVCQLACRFLTANAAGQLEFGWYTDGPALTSRDILGGSLSYGDYLCPAVEKVHLQLTEDSVGAVWPDTAESLNTCRITGNYLLSGLEFDALQQAAEVIYGALSPITYTPCKLKTSADSGILPGQLLTVTDSRGITFRTLVMKTLRAGQSCEAEATGSPSRESSSAVNNQSFGALRGKLMELRKSLEGLELTVSSTDSALHQEIFTQSTAVLADCRKILLSALEGYVTEGEEADYRKTVESQLSLLADQLQLRFQTVTEQTQAMGSELRQQLTEVYKYFNFSQDGLVIGSGDSAITLTLDNSGIVFQKNGRAFGHWDGNHFYTGNIVVTADETARFGNFAFRSGADGSLSFAKAGG